MSTFAVICVVLVVVCAAYLLVNRRKIKKQGLEATAKDTIEDLRERL